MKQNEKGKTNQTARTHAAKRATKMRKTTAGRTQQMNKVKDNISQNMQVFVSHLFVIPAFSSFFFSNFPQLCGKQVFKKCETKITHQKKQNNAKMSAKYTILRICYLSKTHFVRDILQKLQKLQVEVVKTKHSCKTPVIETGTSMTQRDLGLAMAAHVIMSVVDL